MKKGWAHTRAMLAATLAGLVGACGGVVVKPEPVLPKPLIAQIDADVGLIAPADMRKYVDKETRFGTDWEIVVGPGETRMMQDLFRDLFRHVQDLADLDAGRAAKGLQAIFEPRIEQYSFVTSHETGDRYYAVTIRYRIDLYTPQGDKFDSYTLTGYGSCLAQGMSNGKPLATASAAAMRDAAAKFLVQFPEQAAAQHLARREVLVADRAPVSLESSQIEAVPIDESEADLAVASAPPSAPPAAGPPPAAPASSPPLPTLAPPSPPVPPAGPPRTPPQLDLREGFDSSRSRNFTP
ncbi:MAG TPA: hypothetical protein VJQ47_15750 [Steroidobacteraceae bacterium]|nr:hypothetical protein [Steroidobacteraceae bacterium]